MEPPRAHGPGTYQSFQSLLVDVDGLACDPKTVRAALTANADAVIPWSLKNGEYSRAVQKTFAVKCPITSCSKIMAPRRASWKTCSMRECNKKGTCFSCPSCSVHLCWEHSKLQRGELFGYIVAAMQRILGKDLEGTSKMCGHDSANFVMSLLICAADFSDIAWFVSNLRQMQEQEDGSLWHQVVRNKKACRVLQRVLEFHGHESEVQEMITHGLSIQHLEKLDNNEYARYVIEKALQIALEFSLHPVVESIVETVTRDVEQTAKS